MALGVSHRRIPGLSAGVCGAYRLGGFTQPWGRPIPSQTAGEFIVCNDLLQINIPRMQKMKRDTALQQLAVELEEGMRKYL